MSPHQSAPQLLRTARRQANLTQSELAERLGTTQSAVAHLERAGSNPTMGTLATSLQALGLRLELSARPRLASIDETLLARNLRMTAAQRLAAFETAHREVQELRRLFAAHDAG